MRIYLLPFWPRFNSAEKHQLAHSLGCTWLSPPLPKLRSNITLCEFIQRKVTQQGNIIPAELGLCFCVGDSLCATAGAVCVCVHLQRAPERRVTPLWPFSLPYEKESALRCRRRTNPLFTQS